MQIAFIFSAIVISISLPVTRLSYYIAGLELNASWGEEIRLLVGIAFLIYLFTMPFVIYRILRKKISKKWVIGIFAIPLALLLPRIPVGGFPERGFQEGVRDTIRRNVTPEEMFAFANKVRSTYRGDEDYLYFDDHSFISIEKAGSVIRALEASNPSVDKYGVVTMEQTNYHRGFSWGLAIGKSCSKDGKDFVNCLEIYPGVWVWR